MSWGTFGQIWSDSERYLRTFSVLVTVWVKAFLFDFVPIDAQ